MGLVSRPRGLGLRPRHRPARPLSLPGHRRASPRRRGHPLLPGHARLRADPRSGVSPRRAQLLAWAPSRPCRRASPGLPRPRDRGRHRGGHHARRPRCADSLPEDLSRADPHADGGSEPGTGRTSPGARDGRLRAGGDRGRGGTVEPAGRNRRHLLAYPRSARARGVLRGRGRIAPALRSDHAAIRGDARRADGAPPGGSRRRSRPARVAARGGAGRPRRPRAPRGATGGGALRRAPRPGARSLPAARAAAPSARRWACAAGRHGHALGGRLPGPLQGPRGGDPELARGRIRRASGRGRRGAGRALPRHPPGARSGAVARRHPLERGGPRCHHGRLRGGLPAARPRARPARRGGRLRRAPAAAAPSRLPAGRGHRRLHRPQPGRPRGPRGARHRPLPRPAHHGRGGPQRGLPAPRVRRGRPPLSSRRAPRPDLEVHGRAVGGGAARSHGRRRLAARQGVRAGRGAPDGRAAPSPLRRALRGGAADLLGRHAVAAGIRGGLPLRGDARPAARHRGHQAGHGGTAPHGPPGRGRCRLRQDGGRPARGLQGGGRRTAGRRPRAHHGAGPAALPHLQRSLLAVPDPRGAAVPLP